MLALDDVVGRIGPADPQAKRAAETRQSRLTKPPGSLGRLEELSLQLAGVFRTERPAPQGKAVIVAAADHGVVAQGVTGYPQDVTAQMVLNFLAGGAAVNVMARKAGVELVIVDAGVATPLPEHPDSCFAMDTASAGILKLRETWPTASMLRESTTMRTSRLRKKGKVLSRSVLSLNCLGGIRHVIGQFD